MKAIELPYDSDSYKYMLTLARLPNPVFLDSAGHGPPDGRFDILSACPLVFLDFRHSRWRVTPPMHGLPVTKPDLSILSVIADHFTDDSVGKESHDLPFVAGWIGCLGYPALRSNRTLTLQRAWIGFYAWSIVIDHLLHTAQLTFHDLCPDTLRTSVLQILDAGPQQPPDFRLAQTWKADLDARDYLRAVNEIKNYIQAGDCYQVNFTQRFSAKYVGNPLTAFLALRRAGGNPYSAFLGLNEGAILSHSPEQFLSVTERTVTTRPIKGTRPRSAYPDEDQRLAQELATSVKDQAESLMIVDLLRNDLGRCCEIGSIQVPEIHALHSYPTVHHLVSTVTGRLRTDISPLKVLVECFPGGSVTGAPKLRAMEIIRELERFPRDAYCGSFFYQDVGGRLDSNITIRTIQCQDDELRCWGGGAIVADSDPTQEYQESLDKIAFLLHGTEAFR